MLYFTYEFLQTFNYIICITVECLPYNFLQVPMNGHITECIHGDCEIKCNPGFELRDNVTGPLWFYCNMQTGWNPPGIVDVCVGE